jgi:hypothetical protein
VLVTRAAHSWQVTPVASKSIRLRGAIFRSGTWKGPHGAVLWTCPCSKHPRSLGLVPRPPAIRGDHDRAKTADGSAESQLSSGAPPRCQQDRPANFSILVTTPSLRNKERGTTSCLIGSRDSPGVGADWADGEEVTVLGVDLVWHLYLIRVDEST